MAMKKKVLVVDDSAFMRRVISDIINSDSRCEVIATAINGKEGLQLAADLKPDVITLDVQMPIMTGLEMLRRLKDTKPVPVVMLSTLMKEGAKETIEALELGAYDFIKKPDNIFKINSDDIRLELIDKIVQAAENGMKAFNQSKTSSFKPNLQLHPKRPENRATGTAGTVSKLVAIGTSTGGPKALQYVLPFIPSNINAGIVVVQHMPPGFTKSLSDRLDQLSQIRVKEAQDKDVVENGTAYIAPGDKHLVVKQESGGKLVLYLNDDPPIGGLKPCANVMLKSISSLQGKQLTGVIMTGMGADGTEGMTVIRNQQPIHIIAQNEPTCVVYGMPKSIVEKGLANEVIALEKIADAIVKQTGVL